MSLSKLADRAFQFIIRNKPPDQAPVADPATEAERNFQRRDYREAAKGYAACLHETDRLRVSGLKKARIVVRLAESLRRAGDLDEALSHGEDAIKLAFKVGETHSIYGLALDVLSKVKEDRRDNQGALALARLALSVAITAKDAPVCAEASGRVADLEHKTGDAATSKRLREESIEYYKRAHGDNHPGTATQLASLAKVLQDDGQLDEALPLFEKAYVVHKEKLGASARETLADLERIGQIHYLQGNLEQALSSYDKLARLKENEIGGEPSEHGLLLIDAATVHEVAGETGKAMDFLIQAKQKVGRDAKLGPIILERLARLQAAGS